MTNTKFRKRALLSSVAMLLVALVALGSATFAWFQSNPDAQAKGLQMRTTASSGLVIRTDTDTTWGHYAVLGAASGATFTGDDTSARAASEYINVNLEPVSQDQDSPTTFYSVSATGADAKTADPDGTVGTKTATQTASGPVYQEKVYFRLSDGAADATSATIQLQGVTITANDATGIKDIYSAVRVSVTNKSGALIGTYGIAAPANKTLNKKAAAEGNDYSDDYELVNFDPAAAAATGGLTATAYSGALTSADSTANFVTVYVWLDGEDAKCFSNNVGTVAASLLVKSIQLNFKLTAVS